MPDSPQFWLRQVSMQPAHYSFAAGPLAKTVILPMTFGVQEAFMNA